MRIHETIKRYVDILVSSEDIYLFILSSPPGLGKTTTVLGRLKSLGMQENKHYVYVNGHMTPLRLYDFFRESNVLDEPRILVFDDIDALLRNRTSLDIMKAALSTSVEGKRIISYESTAGNREGSFEVKSKVILITNNLSHNKALKPLTDRGIVYDLEASPEELAEYIERNIDSFGGNLETKEKHLVWEKVSRFVDVPGFSLRALDRAMAFRKTDKENWYELFCKTIRKNK